MRSHVRRVHPMQALYLLFLAYLFWSLVFVPRAYAEAPRIHGQGRLFEVSAEGAPPSYVFGTMHINDRKVLKLPAPIGKALRNCRVLFLESGTERVGFNAMLRGLSFTDGRTLRDVLDADLYARVIENGRAQGIPRRVLDQLKPGALWLFIDDDKSYRPWRESSRPVLDSLLLQFANNKGIPVQSLDRVAEVFAIFTSRLSDKEQVELVRHIMSEDRPPMPLQEMRDAYLAGDLDKLHSYGVLFGEGAIDDLEAKLDHELLFERNHRWIPRLKKQLSHGGVFVAVGAAHLSGENGVLHLLEKEGFKVRRVH